MKAGNGPFMFLIKSMVYKLICRYKKFIKFGFVALGYNLIAYLIYAGLVFIKCNYLLASIVAFVFGVFLSYFMNKTLVFSEESHSHVLVVRYFLFYFALLGANLLMLHFFVQFLHVNPYLAQVVVTMLAAILSYNTMRFLVFRK